ncbi:DNA translocase FtsK 4TM domain-containing protein [Vibrio sp. WXL103]|uniref:DNA translocase FtsK n=1 Tax=Vibrio sp. WXL103 TaxID=3450710 RepID=UPI003EC7E501
MFMQNKAKTVKTIIKTGHYDQNQKLSGIQRLREAGLILLILGSVFLAIALFTFNPADPSWSQTSWEAEVQNSAGRIGAWLADTMFFTFGILAYIIPFIVTMAAWVTLRSRRDDEEIDFMMWGTKLIGLVTLILTSCVLADINFDDIWKFSSGGVIGDVLSSIALPLFNVLGTTLVMLFVWGAGFTLLTGLSWLTIVEWLGERTILAGQTLLAKIRGDERRVYQPQLESDQAEREVIDLNSSPEVALVNAESQESISHDPLFATPRRASEAEESRRYNIHMPESQTPQPAPYQAQEPASQAQELTTQAQEFSAFEEGQFDIDEQAPRSQQLEATIADLERQAMADDDLAIESEAAENEPQPMAVADSDDDEIEIFDSSYQDSAAASESVLDVDLEEDMMPSFSAIDIDDEPQSPTPTLTEVDEAIEVATHEQSIDYADSVEEVSAEDEDVAAFQSMVKEAQQNIAAQQNPFLVQAETNLPKPTEPMPTLELLYHPEKRENFIDREALEGIARLVESKLADYKIQARVVDIFPGPVITRFELDLAPGVKVSRISGLSMDLARSLSAMAVRVVEVIPGKPYVGLELPNMSRQTVYFSDVVGSQHFVEAKSPTTVVLGQDIAGEAVIADLAKMPHVLVAGTTGSGKSVGVNVMILSMLYKATPEEVRFIMIDPKMLELSVYEGIPHLLSEVVTDMKDASNALRWCVGEMERRYKLMSALGVRNIKGFNDKLKMAAEAGHPIHDPLWQAGDSMDPEPPLLEKLPYIVVIVDEFADLMMVVGKKVEELIARLAQKARAAGIHLILATQRPSVDVITGLIKANIPTRVAFTVSTKTDSRTILDQGGAESLLGMGDMLYLPPGSSHTIRVHGAFASDDDVHAVVNNWKARGKPNYIEAITSGDQGPEGLLPGEQPEGEEEMDPLFDQVVEHVVQSRRGSVSGVQRRFKIGYNRAARIVEQLEAQGIVSAPGHNGNREVLAPAPNRDAN